MYLETLLIHKSNFFLKLLTHEFIRGNLDETPNLPNRFNGLFINIRFK